MKNMMGSGLPARDNRGMRPFAAALGAGLTGATRGPLTQACALGAARPRSWKLGTAPAPQVTAISYQHKTRIAANGGNASGSHTAWDPV